MATRTEPHGAPAVDDLGAADRRLVEQALAYLDDWLAREVAAHGRLWASDARYRRLRDNWTARLPRMRAELEEVDPGELERRLSAAERKDD